MLFKNLLFASFNQMPPSSCDIFKNHQLLPNILIAKFHNVSHKLSLVLRYFMSSESPI
jgi:hypothetical protein